MTGTTPDSELETESEYNYCRENAVLVSSTPYYGFQATSDSVGKASSKEIYCDYKTRTRNFNLKYGQIGNIVQVFYRNRSVSTPFRIAFLQKGEEEPAPYRDGWFEQEFSMVLDPVNKGVGVLLLQGTYKYNPSSEGGSPPDTESFWHEWSARRDDDHTLTQILDFINSDQSESLTVRKQMRKVGTEALKFRTVDIISDESCMDLFGVKDSSIMPLII